MEKPVIFKNSSNQTLFGILHTPESGKESGKRIGINLLNPGLKNRVAPNRLNVKIARALCDRGYYVLRFDPQGIGDSEGNFENIKLVNIWHKIQTGYFVQDTLESNQHFTKECGLDRIVLIGGCGAANTALIAGAQDKYVDHLILIDLPVNIISTSEDPIWIRDHKSNNHFATCSDKLKVLLKNKARHFLTKFNIPYERYLSRNDNSSDDFNCETLRCFNQFVSLKKNILLIFAEMDPAFNRFNEYFENKYLKDNKYREMYEIILIKNANHAYYSENSQDSLVANIISFLNTKYVVT